MPTASNSSPSILSLKGVTFQYANTSVIASASLDAQRGCITALLGPSGSGKSTLLRLICGLERSTKGVITIDGQIVDDGHHAVPPHQRNVAMMMQDYALFDHLNVSDNIRFAVRENQTKAQSRVNDLLFKTGTATLAHRSVGTLSGGEQQRIALARTLAANSSLVLLDEPFSSLDTFTRRQVRDRTMHLLRNLQASAIVVTHDPQEAMSLADTIIAFDQGRTIQSGTPEELYRHPNSLFVMGLLGEVNVARARVLEGRALSLFGTIPVDAPNGTTKASSVRPEHVILERTETVAESTAGTARVLDSRFHGNSTLVHLAALDHWHDLIHVHAELDNRVPPPPLGTIVRLRVESRHIHLFDWDPKHDPSAKG